MKIHFLLLLFALVYAQLSSATDIASSVREGRAPSSDKYGTFELGVALGYVDNPYVTTQEHIDGAHIGFDASGEVRFKNFFFEASQGTQDGLNLGYTAWSNDDWSIDFLGASMIGLLGELDEDDASSNDEDARNQDLEERETFYLGTGIRITRYFDNVVVQYRLVGDTFKNNGVISTVRIGRGWQVQNWHFSSIVSAQYTSRDTNDYWHGVDPDEATEKYPEYKASASTSYSLLLSATKPLTEKWVMRAYLGYAPISSKLNDSPLISEPAVKAAVVTLNYVFY